MIHHRVTHNLLCIYVQRWERQDRGREPLCNTYNAARFILAFIMILFFLITVFTYFVIKINYFSFMVYLIDILSLIYFRSLPGPPYNLIIFKHSIYNL